MIHFNYLPRMRRFLRLKHQRGIQASPSAYELCCKLVTVTHATFPLCTPSPTTLLFCPHLFFPYSSFVKIHMKWFLQKSYSPEERKNSQEQCLYGLHFHKHHTRARDGDQLFTTAHTLGEEVPTTHATSLRASCWLWLGYQSHALMPSWYKPTLTLFDALHLTCRFLLSLGISF